MSSPKLSVPLRILVTFGAVLATGSCWGGASGPRNPLSETTSPANEYDGPRLPDEITRAEIDSRGSNDHTAMALIRRLRPAWLRARGQKSLTDESADYPVVYIDEIRHGSLSTLNTIPAAEIDSMRFFNQADATTRWGTGHPSGVINIVTGRF